jgi:hypothetical protein
MIPDLRIYKSTQIMIETNDGSGFEQIMMKLKLGKYITAVKNDVQKER